MVLYSQNADMQPEIQLSDGLPVLSTRKILVDENGTVLVATDAGLHVSPDYRDSYKKVKSALQNLQIWDLVFLDSFLYVATYNKGLFIFNKDQGNLVVHYTYAAIPKIRKLRLIEQRLFCIASLGLYEVEKTKLSLLFYTKKSQHRKENKFNPWMCLYEMKNCMY